MAKNGALSGRVALVTGGGRGLGRAYALLLAREGASVLVNDLGCSTEYEGSDATVAGAVVEEIRSSGGTAAADTSDIGSFAEAARAVEKTIETFGKIDILINNAGVVGRNEVEDVTSESYQRLIDMHFGAAVGAVNAAFPVMKRQRYGRIVNTLTEAVFNPALGGGIVYTPAKAAIMSATIAIAKAGEAYGITANAVSPVGRTRLSGGAVDRFGQQGLDFTTEKVASVVLKLVTEDAGDINGKVFFTGAGLVREYGAPPRTKTDLARRLESEAALL